MKTKIGAKRLYNRASPAYGFADYISFRNERKKQSKSARDTDRRYFGNKVRRMLKRILSNEEVHN